MSPRERRVVAQIAVLVPTLAASFWLGERGVPPLPRIVGALGVGLVAIALTTVWQRRSG